MTVSQPTRTGELVPVSSCLRSKLFIIVIAQNSSKHCCAEKEVTLTVGKCMWSLGPIEAWLTFCGPIGVWLTFCDYQHGGGIENTTGQVFNNGAYSSCVLSNMSWNSKWKSLLDLYNYLFLAFSDAVFWAKIVLDLPDKGKPSAVYQFLHECEHFVG